MTLVALLTSLSFAGQWFILVNTVAACVRMNGSRPARRPKLASI